MVPTIDYHGKKKGYRIESHIKVRTEELLILSSLHIIIGSGLVHNVQ